MTIHLKRGLFPIIASFLAIVCGNAPQCATLIVPDDYAMIQCAINAACAGDEIEVKPGTYYEAIDFKGKAIRLYSSAGSDETTIDGTGHEHVVQCVSQEGADTVLEGFTIRGGNTSGTGGGMYNSNSSPTISNCLFTGNEAQAGGGGMYNFHSNPTLTNCSFVGNRAWFDFYPSPYGGGLYNESSSPTITDCNFNDNHSDIGGGMYNSNSSPTITNCNFHRNISRSDGAGIYNKSSCLVISSCTFNENFSASGAGGGIENIDSSLTVSGCTFIDNNVWGAGGGMYNRSSNLVISDSIFERNYSEWSGGGGMMNSDSSLLVTNCKFIHNSSISGSGMFNGGSQLVVTNCVFNRNWGAQGTAMGNLSSSLVIVNCTFAHHQETVLFSSSDFPALVLNSIFWNDQGAQNIEGEATVFYSNIQGGWSGTGNIDADPLFVDPDGADDIIGNEDDDFHLTAGSPCIDQGSAQVPEVIDPAWFATQTDMDGDPRVVGIAPDMGADEFDLEYPFFMDADGDGFGDPNEAVQASVQPAGYVSDASDCDDSQASIHPGAAEVCNGADDDCDGTIDEGVTLTFFEDADGDGFGNPGTTQSACAAPEGYVPDDTDCDDSDASIYPGAAEIDNDMDDDCDGDVDEGFPDAPIDPAGGGDGSGGDGGGGSKCFIGVLHR